MWRVATLADVARRAGVSTATASRIINSSPKPVAEALRERVLAAVAELQFVPNAHAQQLARADRSAVGVIVHDVSDPYFAEITRGLQRVATDHGRLVIICNSYRDPERELDYVELLHAHQVAAIVLAGSGYHDAPVDREAGRVACGSTSGPAAGSPSSGGTSTPATRSCRPTSTAAISPATRSTGWDTPRSG